MTRQHHPSLGMDARTGQRIDGLAHLNQSIVEILLTMVGTRCMNRTFGSRWCDHLDRPGCSVWLLQTYAAIADALQRWEPRINLTRVQVLADSGMEQGKFLIALQWKLAPDYYWLVPGLRPDTVNDQLYTLEVAA